MTLTIAQDDLMARAAALLRRAAATERQSIASGALWCPHGAATPHPEWPHLCNCTDCTADAAVTGENLRREQSLSLGFDVEQYPAISDRRHPHPDFDRHYLRSWYFRWELSEEGYDWRDPLEGWPVRLRWDAEPPADKFELLALIEPRFERSYRRRRPDLRDQSDSSYDFSLALFAFDAGWNVQEVADLHIAGRREHGDISKPGKALRQDYQERTLRKALLTVARRPL